MKVDKMKKEDLELMSYNDIANLILEESTKKTTAELFKKICDLLDLGEKTYENKIGAFYTSLTKDKRFPLFRAIFSDWVNRITNLFNPLSKLDISYVNSTCNSNTWDKDDFSVFMSCNSRELANRAKMNFLPSNPTPETLVIFFSISATVSESLIPAFAIK